MHLHNLNLSDCIFNYILVLCETPWLWLLTRHILVVLFILLTNKSFLWTITLIEFQNNAIYEVSGVDGMNGDILTSKIWISNLYEFLFLTQLGKLFILMLEISESVFRSYHQLNLIIMFILRKCFIFIGKEYHLRNENIYDKRIKYLFIFWSVVHLDVRLSSTYEHWNSHFVSKY